MKSVPDIDYKLLQKTSQKPTGKYSNMVAYLTERGGGEQPNEGMIDKKMRTFFEDLISEILKNPKGWDRSKNINFMELFNYLEGKEEQLPQEEQMPQEEGQPQEQQPIKQEGKSDIKRNPYEPPFGSVEWQKWMLDEIKLKLKSGERLDDKDMAFLETQLEHAKRHTLSSLKKRAKIIDDNPHTEEEVYGNYREWEQTIRDVLKRNGLQIIEIDTRENYTESQILDSISIMVEFDSMAYGGEIPDEITYIMDTTATQIHCNFWTFGSQNPWWVEFRYDIGDGGTPSSPAVAMEQFGRSDILKENKCPVCSRGVRKTKTEKYCPHCETRWPRHDSPKPPYGPPFFKEERKEEQENG